MTRSTPINVIGRQDDPVLEGLLSPSIEVERVDSIEDLRSVLAFRSHDSPATLDLIGHSTTAARLLRLGRSIIDMCDPRVARVFPELADDRIFDQAGVVAWSHS